MSVDHAAKLGVLLDRLAKEYPDAVPAPMQPAIDPDEPLLTEFVRSMLLWESTQPLAAGAMKRIEASVVDYNELRVCMPRDLVRIIGEDYPRARDRAERLRASLNDVFRQHHAVTLRYVEGLGKREAKQCIDSLSGVPPFVSARVALLGHANHSMPMDSRLLSVLAAAKAVEPSETIDGAASWVERKVHAGDLVPVYLRLQIRADAVPVSSQPPDLRVAPVSDKKLPSQPARAGSARRAAGGGRGKPA